LEVLPRSDEYNKVQKAFYSSMPSFDKSGRTANTIAAVYKVENYTLRQHWIHEVHMLHQKNHQVPTIKLLFHGSNNLPPE